MPPDLGWRLNLQPRYVPLTGNRTLNTGEQADALTTEHTGQAHSVVLISINRNHPTVILHVGMVGTLTQRHSFSLTSQGPRPAAQFPRGWAAHARGSLVCLLLLFQTGCRERCLRLKSFRPGARGSSAPGQERGCPAGTRASWPADLCLKVGLRCPKGSDIP